MNDILFGNNNRGVLRRLAKADLRQHKLKTGLTALIILLATCLMGVTFSVLINDALAQANQAPYHAIYRATNEQMQELLKSDPDFESIGSYKNFGSTIDQGGRTDLAYMDNVAMSFMGFQLINGEMPQSKTDALVSQSYLNNRHLEIGDVFSFSYTNALTNQVESKQFTICGIISNKPQEQGKQFYILTSDLFRADFASENSTVASDFSTQTAASVDTLVLLDVEKSQLSPSLQADFLKAKGMSIGVQSFDIILNHHYIDGFRMDGTVIAGIVLFALFLMFASSFVIYSIFYISVVNSMQMYAQLMSLGTTEKQLRRFLNIQGNILSFRVIPIGMAFSLFIIAIISGFQWMAYDLPIIAFSGLLTLAVIKVALKKPTKLLVGISPIDAMKYSGTQAQNIHKPLKRITPFTLAKSNLIIHRKKTRMSIVSLSISGTLMIALAILIASINLPAMLMQSYPLNEDFQIGIRMDNFYGRFPQIVKNNPLGGELEEQIYAIPGVEKIARDECVIGYLVNSVIEYESREDSMATINRISPELAANVSEVVSGTVSCEALGANDIVLNKYRTDRSDLNYNDIQVGDTLNFECVVDEAIVEYSFRVAGIAYFPSTGLFYCTSDAIAAISPYDNISHLSIFCEPGREAEVHEELTYLISGNPNLNLKVYAEEQSSIEGFIGATMTGLYGISAFIIIFGVLNMINMLINSAIVRKREFALLQAVGMTNIQLRKMLYREGMDTSLKSVAIAAVLGIVIGRLFCYLANEVMALKFIIFNMSVWPVLSFAIVLIGLQLIVNYGICKAIEKDTLTERLRTD